MPKFYPHNAEEYRALHEQFRKDANGDWVMSNFLQLKYIAENGLPDCYTSFEDFTYDFFPDFSWDSEIALNQHR